MSGTIRFDDEHIVKFTLDAENMLIYLTITVSGTEYVLAPVTIEHENV